MPKLEELHITTEDHQEEILIIQSLPKLIKLNGNTIIKNKQSLKKGVSNKKNIEDDKIISELKLITKKVQQMLPRKLKA